MSLPKLVIIFTVVLFSVIGIAAFLKKDKKINQPLVTLPIEIDLAQGTVKQPTPFPAPPPPQPLSVKKNALESKVSKQAISAEKNETDVPHANRIDQFFNKDDRKFPIVETITYRSRVSWQKGRPAWLSDYAGYYSTSRHFIARSLNGKPDYLKQDVAEGDRFNVLRKDKSINFYLLVDVSRNRLWFYYLNLDTKQRVLVKDYAVGVGRDDPDKASGLLTPLGKYTLGSKIAVYKPKMTGYHNGQKVEMLRVFGTRWIPFEKELSGTTAPAKGFGIHGVPWKANEKGVWHEDKDCLGKHLSDGCIRLATADIEELFAVIITKPTTIEIVKDFKDASLPGIEK
jgi:lipoprotein-anchoring transpeptidase ErfK/SrfK